MTPWTRIRALSAADWRVLTAAAGLLTLARAGLPHLRFEAAGALRDASPAELERARAMARLVLAASRRLPFATTCLHRSVVLWWLLRRRGIPAAIRLGARTESGPFEAHAWVACGGIAVGESPGHLATFQDPASMLNQLTSRQGDRITQAPEYKVTAVCLEPSG